MKVVRPGLFPDDAIVRTINRENVLLLGGGRALLMQLAHPKIAAGVDEHSDFRRAPMRRLRRTIRMTMAIVFGDRETALAAVRSVNQTHARVRGAHYRAMDPNLLLWVHATLVDSALVTYETFVRPLSAGARQDFYRQMNEAAQLLGVPREKFPKTFADFREYVTGMVESGPVRVEPLARELAQNVLRPPLRLVPGGAMIPFEIVTTGLLPATLREQYGLAWGGRQERFYRLVVKALPRLIAVTPPILRVWPLPGHNVSLAPNLSVSA
jgi:uncharacterized protein (DUF2236 family)